MQNILRVLAFREIAMMFLKSYNPRCEKEVVVADAIMAYDGEIPDGNCRYLASDFVRQATSQIESNQPPIDTEIANWIGDWNKEFGVA